jgi:hypothetical protein
LTELDPKQVAEKWWGIREAIENSLPPIVKGSPNRIHNILEAILLGRMKVWIIQRVDGQNGRPIGITTSIINDDDITGLRTLTIFSLYGLTKWEPEDWVGCWNQAVKVARKYECDQILAYTEHDNIANAAKQVGGDTDTRLMIFRDLKEM